MCAEQGALSQRTAEISKLYTVYPLMILSFAKENENVGFMPRRCDFHNAGCGWSMIVRGSLWQRGK